MCARPSSRMESLAGNTGVGGAIDDVQAGRHRNTVVSVVDAVRIMHQRRMGVDHPHLEWRVSYGCGWPRVARLRLSG